MGVFNGPLPFWTRLHLYAIGNQTNEEPFTSLHCSFMVTFFSSAGNLVGWLLYSETVSLSYNLSFCDWGHNWSSCTILLVGSFIWRLCNDPSHTHKNEFLCCLGWKEASMCDRGLSERLTGPHNSCDMLCDLLPADKLTDLPYICQVDWEFFSGVISNSVVFLSLQPWHDPTDLSQVVVKMFSNMVTIVVTQWWYLCIVLVFIKMSVSVSVNRNQFYYSVHTTHTEWISVRPNLQENSRSRLTNINLVPVAAGPSKHAFSSSCIPSDLISIQLLVFSFRYTFNFINQYSFSD